jgi:hypothetical protein
VNNPGQRTLGVGEVDDVAVLLEHVNLLDGLDGLSVELLEGSLELPVVGAGPGGRTLCLPAGSSLATINTLSAASYFFLPLIRHWFGHIIVAFDRHTLSTR